jgi:N-acetylmuramoyl-L-alanine amidase-like protein
VAYPFVQAYHDYGLRNGPTRAFLVHMAEGGGTVGYLSRANPNGVSVHYVIEYTGRVVQMLREDHASGSVNPREIRTTDDPDGFYGATAAKAVMGAYWSDPNSAVISCEIEGYAKDGPNDKQKIGLSLLVKDVRSRHSVGLLGHRDFQDYKACPGRLIPWTVLGGHGAQEIDMPGLKVTKLQPWTGLLTIEKPGVAAIRVSDKVRIPISGEKDGVYKGVLDPPLDTLPGDRATVYGVGDIEAVVLAMDVIALPTAPVDCDDVVETELDKAATRAAVAVRAR